MGSYKWGSKSAYIGFIGFISGVIGRVAVVITHISGLITILITTHEPPSRGVS